MPFVQKNISVVQSVLAEITLFKIHRKHIGKINSILKHVRYANIWSQELSGLVLGCALTAELNSACILDAYNGQVLCIVPGIAKDFVEQRRKKVSGPAVCLGAQLPQFIRFA